jgi:hypothetical protein
MILPLFESDEPTAAYPFVTWNYAIHDTGFIENYSVRLVNQRYVRVVSRFDVFFEESHHPKGQVP